MTQDLVRLIDEAVALRGGEPGHEDTEPRGHLGASVIGKECWREIWYGYRWALPSSFEGRMLRLFATGFKYEPRFIAVLKLIGVEVKEIDYDRSAALLYHPESDSYIVATPEERAAKAHNMEPLDDVTSIPWHVARAASQGLHLPKMKQFGFKDSTGHFAGSCDGIAHIATGVNSPIASWLALFGMEIYDEFLCEFKTHNAKSFNNLLDMKVQKAKPSHYAQMVTYMQRKGIKIALYCAVNKDTDQLYFEWVAPDSSLAEQLSMKAVQIISAKKPPARISNSPSWFGCRICDYRMPCHYGKPMAKNCRTCINSEPVLDGKWKCNKWNEAIIPFDAQQIGCDSWKQIND